MTTITAKILRCIGLELLVLLDLNIDRELLQKQITHVEIILHDGRSLSVKQRKKIFAICNDIAEYQGDDPLYVRPWLTARFCDDSDIDLFTLSRRPKTVELPDGSKIAVEPADMTTARKFITWLINFCFEHYIPTNDSLLTLCDDTGRYFYLCLEHRKCAICNDPADIHHVKAIGMGRNRSRIVHLGYPAMALCRKHHTEAETIGR
ncbi:MAG: putative HNHc nuclease, partial [Syntrophorhabdaceae bacterium]|nr:putative HNHc nuclease [Syntrophorhabdaceae bacterium]